MVSPRDGHGVAVASADAYRGVSGVGCGWSLSGWSIVSKLIVVTHAITPSGSARRLDVFARAMPRGEVEIALLGPSSPWSRSLAEAGVPVYTIDPFEPRNLWQLRQRVQGADHVWAWGAGVAWPLLLVGVRPSRLRLISPLSSGSRPSLALGWLVRRCVLLVADGAAAAEALRRLGVQESRLRVVLPGVEPVEPVEPAKLPGLPDDAQVLLAIGPIARHKGQREAVWAFDILAFVGDRLHLVIVGDGPDVEGVRRFSEVTRREGRTHFVGPVADLGPWLARANVVLVAGTGGGRMTILDAMAAGRPVVATRSADRVELLDHGRTGLFATVGDIPGLCRQIKAVIDDESLALTLGANARAEAATRFGVAAFVEAMRGM